MMAKALALFAAFALAACSDDNTAAPEADGPLPKIDGGLDAGHLPDAEMVTVTVKVVDIGGNAVAGSDIVFHDPDGNPVAATQTDESGEARQPLSAGGGVTVLESGNVVSALDLPAGAVVRLRSSRIPSTPTYPSFEVTPVLPPIPSDALPFDYAGVAIVCPGPGASSATVDIVAGAATLETSCVPPDGTYGIEGRVETYDKVYRLRLTGIAASDRAPTLPAWEEVPIQTFGRVPADAFAWGIAAANARASVSRFEGRGMEASLIAEDPDDEFLFEGRSFAVGGGQTWVRLHDLAPHKSRATLDFEPDRTRAPAHVQIARNGPAPAVSWEESGPGQPGRFTFATYRWSVVPAGSKDQVNGGWTLISAKDVGRATFPTLPAELRHFVEPDTGGARFLEDATVTLADDSGAASYGDFLADDPLRLVANGRAPAGARVERMASAFVTQTETYPASPFRVSYTTDPPMVDGVATVAAGSTLHITARIGGGESLTWPTVPGLVADGLTASFTPEPPGRLFGLPIFGFPLPVRVLSPECLRTFPSVRPLDPDAQIVPGQHIPLVVRRDGSPVLAFATQERHDATEKALQVIGWDGAAWSDVAPSIEDAPAYGPDVFGLALDANDTPIVAYIDGAGHLDISKPAGDRWAQYRPSLVMAPVSDLSFVLDGAGDPVVATVEGDFSVGYELRVYRWKSGAWKPTTAVSAPNFEPLKLQALAMDGDRPVVSFDRGGDTVRGHVVRLDDTPTDLGDLGTGAPVSGTVRPLVYVPATDAPAVAFVNRNGADAIVVQTKKLTSEGWVATGATFALSADAPTDAAVWDPVSGAAYVAVPSADLSMTEVRSSDDGSLLCTPVRNLESGNYVPIVRSLGAAADPNGGVVVAMEQGLEVTVDHITVQRLQP